MRQPLILSINSLLPELISDGFLSLAAKMTHWQIFSSRQLAWPTVRCAFLFGWLVGFVLFCFISSICPLSSRMPLSHSLLFAAPRCSRFFENTTCGGPKFTMTLLFPPVGHVLGFFLGEKFCVSWPSALPFTTSTP